MKNRHAKLCNEDIKIIRNLNLLSYKRKDIAQIFNVSITTITLIINKKRWTHI